MTPDRLVAAIRAALDERERKAKAAGYHRWCLGVVYGTVMATGNGKTVARDLREYDAEHAITNDPATVLGLITTLREIVDEHSPHVGGACPTCWRVTPESSMRKIYPCPTLTALARGLGINPE